MSDLPTLLFIPGAWHLPLCYTPIIALLSSPPHNLRCITITLPSTQDNPSATFKDDLDTALAAISAETTLGRNVVVIAHSYGGMVGNSAVKSFVRPAAPAAPATPPLPPLVPRSTGSSPSNTNTNTNTDTDNTPRPPTTTTAPAAGYVLGLILIASGFTLTNLSFMDPFLGRPPPAWRVNSQTGYAEIVAPPREFLYHDLSIEEADYWSSQLTTQSLKSLFEGGEHSYAGWRDVPVWYIGTVEDRGLPVVMQRVGVGAARAMGAHVTHRELRTSHSPFLSKPGETAVVIVEAVGAFTGRKMRVVEGEDNGQGQDQEEDHYKKHDEGKTQATRQAAAVVPTTKLWQPITWYRYGVPLLLGRMVGNCFLIFSWLKKTSRR